jgi:hypothetical protein
VYCGGVERFDSSTEHLVSVGKASDLYFGRADFCARFGVPLSWMSLLLGLSYSHFLWPWIVNCSRLRVKFRISACVVFWLSRAVETVVVTGASYVPGASDSGEGGNLHWSVGHFYHFEICRWSWSMLMKITEEKNSDHVAQYNDGIRATRCRCKVQFPVRVKFFFSS